MRSVKKFLDKNYKNGSSSSQQNPHENEDIAAPKEPPHLHFAPQVDPMDHPNGDGVFHQDLKASIPLAETLLSPGQHNANVTLAEVGDDHWSLTVVGSGGSEAKLIIPADNDLVVTQSTSDVGEVDLDTLRARLVNSTRLIHRIKQTIQTCYQYLETEQEANSQLQAQLNSSEMLDKDENVPKFGELAKKEFVDNITPNLMARDERENNQEPSPSTFHKPEVLESDDAIVELQDDPGIFKGIAGRVHRMNFEDLLYEKDPPDVDKLRVVKEEDDDREILKQLEFRGDPDQAIQTLWEWLKVEHIETIKIEGEAGIGKTWTARRLMDRAIAANLFDVVIWVHGGLNFYETLMRIAVQLNVFLDKRELWVATQLQENEEELRKKILESLQQKHFFLVLDDISFYNELYSVVPRPKEKNKSSKILFVGGNELHIPVEKVWKLEKLSKDRAWLLFQEITGSESEMDSPGARELAEPMLESCKRVPFEIVILAGALRSPLAPESSSSSRLGSPQLLANLKKAYNLKIIRSEEMSHAQFICEMLPDKDMKDCFLLSCICPKYHQFTEKELIQFWMKSGSLDGCGSYEKAYEKGRNIFNELINRCVFFRNIILNQNYDTFVTFSVQTQLVNEAIEYITDRWFDVAFLERCTLSGGTGVNREKQRRQSNSMTSEVNLNGSLSLLVYGDNSFRPNVFEQIRNLEDVSLLNVRIRSLPTSLSNLNCLQALVLRGCDTLENVNQIRGLRTLRILSLSGASSLKDMPDDIFQYMGSLETLNLSNTQLKQLPSSFSVLTRIRFLILQGCFHLKVLPPMEEFHQLSLLDLSGASALTRLPETSKSLRMLDLSRTLVAELPSSSNLSDLEYLILRHCSQMKTVPHPYSFPRLRVLDLSGVRACREFESAAPVTRDISDRVYLRFLGLSDRKFLWGFDWVDRSEIIEQLKWDSSGSEDLEIVRMHITVSNTNIFLFIQNLELWGTCFQKFNICLCSPDDWRNEKDIYLQGTEFIFRDMYYQTIHTQLIKEPDRFFKICGFQTFPDGIEQVLSHVEILYLKKNDFVTRLSDLGAENIKVMTGCWIERCDRMEATFYGEEREQNTALGRCLENLLVSCLSELKFLFKGTVSSGSFTCLKDIYVDCCPSLMSLFSSRLELKKLQKLEIKFCEELENICGGMTEGQEAFPMLTTLILWKLPKLKSICDGVLPSIERLRVNGCPELRKLPVINSSSPIKIKGEVAWWNNLEWEAGADLSHMNFTQT